MPCVMLAVTAQRVVVDVDGVCRKSRERERGDEGTRSTTRSALGLGCVSTRLARWLGCKGRRVARVPLWRNAAWADCKCTVGGASDLHPARVSQPFPPRHPPPSLPPRYLPSSSAPERIIILHPFVLATRNLSLSHHCPPQTTPTDSQIRRTADPLLGPLCPIAHLPPFARSQSCGRLKDSRPSA